MIAFVLFSLLGCLLIYDFKKYFVYTFVCSTWISHFEMYGQSMGLWVSLLSFAVYLYKIKHPFADINKFPMFIPFLIAILSISLSNYFAIERHTPSLILMVLHDYVVVFIFWKLYRNDSTNVIRYFIKAMLLLGFVVAFYSMFETVTKTNPFVRYMIDTDAYSYERFIDEIRFGLKRSQGVFSMHTTNAGVSLLLFCTLCFCRINGYIKTGVFTRLMLVFLFMTVFFTGARSGIAALSVSLLMFLGKRYLKFKYVVPIICLMVVVFLFLFGYLQSVWDSFMDTEKVSGSNVDMRDNQLLISLYYLEQSPLLGNGIQYTFTTVKRIDENINGAESIWFTTMIDYGILGIIACAIYFLSCIWYCFKCGMSKLSFFVLAFLLFFTMSSIPNVSMTYMFVYLFMMTEMRRQRISMDVKKFKN